MQRASLDSLNESEFHKDPLEQFRLWLEAAQSTSDHLPNAMVLATATPDGRPSARVVLLKAVDEQGFVFFTNFESRKACELRANPRAALVFYWSRLDRQVRIEGVVNIVMPAESDAYFESRPFGSQISAWASPQSEVIADRQILEARVRETKMRFPRGKVPRPPNWGGYRLTPDSIEFWLHRDDRLHDRLRYLRATEGGWLLERLAP